MRLKRREGKKSLLIPEHIKRSPKKCLFICADLQPANFRGIPLCQATKRHLNNSSTLKTMKNKMRSEITFGRGGGGGAELCVFLLLFFLVLGRLLS